MVGHSSLSSGLASRLAWFPKFSQDAQHVMYIAVRAPCMAVGLGGNMRIVPERCFRSAHNVCAWPGDARGARVQNLGLRVLKHM